jgi:hypothetical protein
MRCGSHRKAMKNVGSPQPNGGVGTKAFFIAYLSGTRTSKLFPWKSSSDKP